MSLIKLAFFSDTHLRGDLFFPEDIDVFFHCGDLLNEGTIAEVQKAARYFKKMLNGRSIYFTPGNHDNVFESSKDREAIEILNGAGFKVYIDGGTLIDVKGQTISACFCPWVPETTPSHAFNLGDDDRRRFIDKIPHSIDILVTHGPPDGILDGVEGKYHFGDQLLLEKISTIRSSLAIHAFGHVHQSRGSLKVDNESPLFINAASGSKGPEWPVIVTYPECKVELE